VVLGTLPKRVVEEEGAEGLECEWKWNNGAVGGVRYFELTIGEERGGISRSVSRAGTPEPNMRGSGAMVLLRPTSSASNSRREEEQEAVVAVERKGLFVRPNQVSLLSSSLFSLIRGPGVGILILRNESTDCVCFIISISLFLGSEFSLRGIYIRRTLKSRSFVVLALRCLHFSQSFAIS
jgi:hypothetical protein